MNMTIEYPHSRMMTSGQCEECKPPAGMMTDSGRIHLQDTSGNSIEFMKWTCNKCGYTVLLDLNIVRNRPLQNQNFEEILPD